MAFRASNGWVCNFVRRHGLKMRRRCGEGGDAHEASAELASCFLSLPCGFTCVVRTAD